MADHKDTKYISAVTTMLIAKCDHIVRILAQLLNAVSYIHEQRYVHGDIKLENLMIDASGRVRLIDFGSVSRLYANIDRKTLLLTEPFSGSGKFETGPDIWAIGQVLYVMLAMDRVLADTGGKQYCEYYRKRSAKRSRVSEGKNIANKRELLRKCSDGAMCCLG